VRDGALASLKVKHVSLCEGKVNQNPREVKTKNNRPKSPHFSRWAAFNPHSFRHALAMLGERTCKTPEEFKAWSQNLSREQVLTTFSLACERCRELVV
jgi:hypothetical protein